MFETWIADPNPLLFRDIPEDIESIPGLKFFVGTFEQAEPNVDAPACIANAGNSLGVMGAGVAGAIRKRYGSTVSSNTVNAMAQGHLKQKIGDSHVVEIGPQADNFKYCAYTITMMEPGERLDPEAHIPLYCMLATLCAVENFNEAHEDDPIKTLVVPGFGAGIGGLAPNEVGFEMAVAYNSYLRNKALHA
jgi:O-acetyl-ADP-ribose deacetylase (regulator of RNase III)